MAIYATSVKATRFLFLILLILTVAAGVSHAKNPPDSIGAIKAVLPDSISLEGKVVYVDFWASWCVPCRHSFPWMQDLYEKYRQNGFEIVAVGVDKDHQSALKFLGEIHPAFTVVFDSTGDLAKRFGLDAMPTSFIYNRNGRLALQNRGFRQDEADSLDGVISRLLTKETSK